jgi:hypothetical protein
VAKVEMTVSLLAAEDSTNFVIPSPTVKLRVAVVPMIKALVEIQADNQLTFPFFVFVFSFPITILTLNTAVEKIRKSYPCSIFLQVHPSQNTYLCHVL